MIAYDTEWLDALQTSREAKQWRTSSIISDDQYAAIKAKCTTPLYTPNLFIRIALFIFSYIALSGFSGMVFLFVTLIGERGLGVVGILVGVALSVALELLVKHRHLYKAGIDDALLYTSLGFTIGGAVWLYLDMAAGTTFWVIPWLIALPFLVWGVVRFADRLVTAAAYICVLGIVFTPLLESGPVGKSILPFAAMAAAMIAYVLARRNKAKEVLHPYEDCLFIVELLALATFYAAGNYYVVRELNQVLMNITIAEGEDISLAFLFYALTALTPLAYVVRGLIIRDHLLLRTGLIAAVLSVLTFRYYFHVIPPEVALTIAGIVLFVLAMAATRHLRTRRDGYTDKHLLHEKLKGLDAEALLVAHSLGASPQAQPVEKKFEGGGGEFGGGGAGGKW